MTFVFPSLRVFSSESETDDEIVRWHHRLNGHEFEQYLGDSEEHRPGILKSRGHRVRHDRATEGRGQQQWLYMVLCYLEHYNPIVSSFW